MKIKVIFLIALLWLLYNYNFSEAFDNVISHPQVTDSAVKKSVLISYLSHNLGNEFLKNYDSVVNGKKVIDWIKKGSTDEDSDIPDNISFLPQCRAVNHFHNPLLSWDQSYMTDQPWYVDMWCWSWKPIYSNITWATSYLSPPPDGTKIPFTYYSSMSPYTWDRARDYYYKALTLTADEDRKIYFAWTFQTVGHVTHLLEDMAVPAHTRNDFRSHLIKNNNYFDRIQPFENYVKNNPTLVATANPAITDFPSFSNLRLTDFWDTDLYSGSNPSILNDIGLAEFSNGNYFSDSTIWNNSPSADHTFPFPKIGNSDYQICFGLAPDGLEYRRYASRKTKGDCPPVYQANNVDHFAAVSLLDDENRIMNQDISLLKYWLDDNVHNTYAKELLPRAVGYSAGLLNYFFRGDIDIIPDDTLGGYIIVNNSDEDLDGRFELYYDNTYDQRILLWSQDNLALGDTNSGNNKSGNINISIPTDALRYVLVFRGRLGNEADAVAGRVYELNRNFIFLVDLYGQTTAFEIKPTSNQYQLLHVSDKTVNIAVYNDSTLLTVQSHPNKTQHIARLPISRYTANGEYVTSYNPWIDHYGEKGEDELINNVIWYGYLIDGLPQAFIPSSFTVGSPYVWDSGFTYGEWVSGQYYARLANYIHGRRPFEVVNNKLVAKNINIRKNDNYTYSGPDYSGPFHIQYKDETGNWVRGIDLPDGNDYLAVLDRNKTIYTRSDLSSQYQTSSEGAGTLTEVITSNFLDNVYCNNHTWTEKFTTTIDVVNVIGSSPRAEEKKIVVGDTVIGDFLIESNLSNSKAGESPTYLHEIIYDSDPNCSKVGGNLVSFTRDYTISGATVTKMIQGKPYTSFIDEANDSTSGDRLYSIMDYDNMDGDKNYILFYSYQDNDSHNYLKALSFGIYGTGNDAIRGIPISDGAVWDYYKYYLVDNIDTTQTGYVIVYKIGSMLNSLDLGINSTRSYSLQKNWDNLNILEDGSVVVDGISTENKSLIGERITGLSVQINDTNMVYTYIIERTNGNEDTWYPDWAFEKRIIGIINISDTALPIGFRQEFEFNSPISGFDFSELSAIGVTR